MSSFTRRRATLLLWLMLALLPLRGWAMGTMNVAMAAPAHEAPAPACHDASGDDAALHAHALCDICHAVAVPASEPSLPAIDRHAGAPIGWVPIAPAEAGPASLFKPPRR